MTFELHNKPTPLYNKMGIVSKPVPISAQCSIIWLKLGAAWNRSWFCILANVQGGDSVQNIEQNIKR